MDKVRVLVLGLGNFGHSWADLAASDCDSYAELVAVVDKREETWQGIDENVPKYSDLDTAIEETKPELIINVTPPGLHNEINEKLLRGNIAVLCEKPVSDNYENAVKMRSVLDETGGFLMIGENYRYHLVFREARKILQNGELGNIHQVVCHFRHYHPDYSMFYHGALKHPLLTDVSIHHLDLARYLSGEEPINVWCREFAADYSWYKHRLASAFIVSDMTGNVVFHYEGTLAAPVSTTDWNGDWEIECDYGVLQIKDSNIFIHKEDKVQKIQIRMKEDDTRIVMLHEACKAIREGRRGETDYADNLKSFGWLEGAIKSSETHSMINIDVL